MNIVCACPACQAGIYQTSVEESLSVTCPVCGQSVAVPKEAIQVSGKDRQPQLFRCLVCPSTELFVRKNFPQRLGVGIVVVGLAMSCITWAYRDLFSTFAILFSTALLDVILFFVVPDCLTCYRCCPHGAIYWDNRAIISPVACQGCGICASECPMDAIQLGDFKDEDMLNAVKENAVAKDDGPSIVAFCCQNSAFEAAEMAAEFKMPLPAGLRMIKVPCAGKIDIDFIMNAFVEGADGVMVMACHAGNCKSDQGNTYAEWRVADAKRMMTETGFETERLKFVTLASNMGSDFSSIALDMEKTLKELGPSPLK